MAAARDRHKMTASITHQEYSMPIDNDNKDQDVKGRNWDQLTTGTTSVATMGAGSTGDVAGSGSKQAAPGTNTESENETAGGGLQQLGRTDDLLAGGSTEEQADEGFQGKTDENGTQGSQAAAAGTSDRAGKGADNK
jgi:hypothetical protein